MKTCFIVRNISSHRSQSKVCRKTIPLKLANYILQLHSNIKVKIQIFVNNAMGTVGS